MRAAFFSLVLFLSALPGAAHAQEMISSFHSLIQVAPDGSMTVTETLKVLAAGDQIKHGIYRDFPTKYRDRYGNAYRVDFSVQRVLRDGNPEEFWTVPRSNGVRVYIGKKNELLSPGEYTYAVTYRTDRQIGFFDRYDELYWNVTGNGWAFPIDKASATVSLPLPDPGMVISHIAFTGPEGSKEGAYEQGVDREGRLVFTCTRVLAPGEGMTIVVSWPKGHVAEPDARQKLDYFLQDNKGVFVGLSALLVVIGYYLVVWSRFGRDPAKGTVFPLFEPPAGMSPAASRYLMRMEYDQKAFTAAVINMAVKKYLVIREAAGKFTLERSPKEGEELSADEKAAAEALFSHGDSITLENANHADFTAAISKLKGSLARAYETSYFLTNRAYYLAGAAISFAGLGVSAAFLSRNVFGTFFMCVWLSIWSLGVGALLFTLGSLWKRVLFNRAGTPAGDKAQAVFLTLFSLPFVAGEIIGLFALVYFSSLAMVAVLLLVVAVNLIFYHLLKAPTLLGRKTMDKLEGFKMYLSVAEKDSLNSIKATPQLFEKYLPYALALDVEQQWANRFSWVLSNAGAEGKSYSPSWYRGTSFPIFAAGGIASFGTALSGAISSASQAPGSSSGSGGGGSSGGGGGGGGGGGW